MGRPKRSCVAILAGELSQGGSDLKRCGQARQAPSDSHGGASKAAITPYRTPPQLRCLPVARRVDLSEHALIFTYLAQEASWSPKPLLIARVLRPGTARLHAPSRGTECRGVDRGFACGSSILKGFLKDRTGEPILIDHRLSLAFGASPCSRPSFTPCARQEGPSGAILVMPPGLYGAAPSFAFPVADTGFRLSISTVNQCSSEASTEDFWVKDGVPAAWRTLDVGSITRRSLESTSSLMVTGLWSSS